MIRLVTYVAAAAALAAIFAGCNSGCSNCVTVLPCGTPAGMAASLIYPAPGSTAIPDNVSQIVLATNSTLPPDWQTGQGWDILLSYPYSGAYGNGHYANEFVTATPPFPTPNATPSFSGTPQYWSSTMSYVSAPNLPPGTLITVEMNDQNSVCFPGVTIGAFTTQ